MSFPNIPSVCPSIGLCLEDSAKLLLASIGFEELALAHLINAEAEKIQSVLGTLKGQTNKNPSIQDLERIDKSVAQMLEDVIKKEMLLQFKLEDVITLLSKLQPVDPSVPSTIPKYVDPLPLPGVLEPKAVIDGVPYYEVTMKEIKQRLHKCFPETPLWGYEGSYPGPAFEVRSDHTIRVKWINELPLSPHLLPVDKTVHGAEPPNPDVRTVVHVHGARVAADSDGYPEAWFTKDFLIKGGRWTQEVYEYENKQRATTLWYHDHALGATRINVVAGLAGFYIIRDDHEDSLNLPKGQFEVPLVIQDRSFNKDGSLFYPSQPDDPEPTFPNPSIVPEFFGNSILANGKLWPFFDVEPRKYRFRILNGSNARFYNIFLSSGQPFFQIGTEGGLLKKPVELTEINLAPAERADVVIDFSNYKGQCIVLRNNAAEPFPNGDSVNPETTGQIMQFRVVLPLSEPDQSVIPSNLSTIEKLDPNQAAVIRDLPLVEETDSFGRLMLMLDGKMWDEPISEKPKFGTIEVWNLINPTPDTHPIHLHLINFQVLNRQEFDVPTFESTRTVQFIGPIIAPDENEKGWKETVKTPPGFVTRIIARFDGYTGEYVWHCHIIEHEDHDMMRPYLVEP
jgi:spore coat protein A, manganese oxidase